MSEKNTFPEPPEHLSGKAKEIYNFYTGKSVRAPGQIALLVRGLELMDTADECARIVQEEGLTVTSKRSKLTRQHPLLNTQREATGQMMKIFKLLNMGANSYRIPDGIGYTDFV